MGHLTRYALVSSPQGEWLASAADRFVRERGLDELFQVELVQRIDGDANKVPELRLRAFVGEQLSILDYFEASLTGLHLLQEVIISVATLLSPPDEEGPDDRE